MEPMPVPATNYAPTDRIPTANVHHSELPEFTNEPFVDWSNPANRRAMEEAIVQVRGQLAREYPMVIGGHRVTTVEKIMSRNPARPDEIVGIHQEPGVEHADAAVDSALAPRKLRGKPIPTTLPPGVLRFCKSRMVAKRKH